jgi:hypothetical protein
LWVSYLSLFSFKWDNKYVLQCVDLSRVPPLFNSSRARTAWQGSAFRPLRNVQETEISARPHWKPVKPSSLNSCSRVVKWYRISVQTSTFRLLPPTLTTIHPAQVQIKIFNLKMALGFLRLRYLFYLLFR